jgi:hypothetical protein
MKSRPIQPKQYLERAPAPILDSMLASRYGLRRENQPSVAFHTALEAVIKTVCGRDAAVEPMRMY